MELENRYNKLGLLYVFFVVLTSTRVWSFHGVSESVFNLIETLNVLVLLMILVYNIKSSIISEGVFSTNVLFFILIPVMGIFSAAVFHGQGYVQSLLALKVNFLWLFYYALLILQLPVRKLTQVMIFMGVIWITITVAQQFTYPTYLFYTRTEETSLDFYRAGVYRFMIDDHHYGLFLLLYFFNLFLIQKKLKYLLPVLFGLVGFYYYGTRQFALASLVCVVIAALAQKGKARAYAIILLGVSGLLLVALSSVLFSGYVELTKEQVGSNEEDIRQLSAEFYLFEYWPNWLAILTGNGLEHPETAYGREIDYLNKTIGFYRTDVGIIGAFNAFGLFHVLNILSSNLKGLRTRFYLPETNYLRLFFFNALLLLIVSEYYTYASTIPFFCLIFYMVDKAMEEKKLEQQEGEHL